MAEKEHWWPKRRIYYSRPRRRLYHWGLKEDPIIEDPKEDPINEKPKKDPITVKPKENSVNENPQGLQDPQWLLRRKLTLLGFLVMVYDTVSSGDKFSKESFGLGGPRFHATSHLKIEARVFFFVNTYATI